MNFKRYFLATLAVLFGLYAVPPTVAAVKDWSTTPSTNSTADAANGINFSEGQSPGSLNDSARAMMAEIKKWYDQVSNVVSVSNGTWSGGIGTVFPTGSVPTSSAGTSIVSATITPTTATSKILVRFSCPVSAPGSGTVGGGVFVSGTTNALAVDYASIAAANELRRLSAEYRHSPATTSALTYTVRVGPTAGTAYVNGNSAGGLAGGTYGCVITLQEVP